MHRTLAVLALVAVASLGCRSRKPAEPHAAADIPRIDAHAHLSAAALPAAMEIYARNHVRGAVNLSGGWGHILEHSLATAHPYGDRVAVLANLDPQQRVVDDAYAQNQVEGLRRAKELGARGLKIYKALGLALQDTLERRVPVDDPRLDPIFEEAGRLGMPVFIHSGDPQAFWRAPTPDNERYDELKKNPGWSYFGTGTTWEQIFGEYERRVARHPKTTFVGVHFGNDPEQPERVAQMLRKYPNLYVDTAARVGEIGRMPPEKLRALFLEFHDRILFGTDFSYAAGEMTLGAPDGTVPGPADVDRFFDAHWRFFETTDRHIPHPTPIQGRWTVDAIGLPEGVLHDLYHRNAERLLGLAPLR